MRIAIFSGYFPPHLGGVERYSDKLASALQDLGHEIIVVTSNDANGINYEVQGTRTVYRLPIYTIAKSRYPLPKRNNEYKALIQKIESEDADAYIVNTRFHLTSLVGSRMGKRLSKPVFLIEHGTAHFTVNNQFFDLFGKIYEHLLSGVIKHYVTKFYGVSQNCNVWSQHFGITAAGVFYNAVDPKDAMSVSNLYVKRYPKKEIIISYAGRLLKEKGVNNLVDAFKNIDLPEARLVIAGDGPIMDDLKERAKDQKIDFVGKLNFQDVMALYKRTDIFVYPSLYPEGLPTSILEAGLMKSAIIATPRGGTEEVIPSNDYGILVDGSTKSLQEAITLLAHDTNLRQKQGSNVAERIKKIFNWKAVARTVELEIKAVE